MPSIASTTPTTDSTSANTSATYSSCTDPPTQAPAVIRYVHSVEVLASTRSPALNTGPLPASRLRTVRSTIRPSSAIHRRCQAPQPNSTATSTTLTHRLTRTVTSYGNAGPRTSRRTVPDARRPHRVRSPRRQHRVSRR